MRFIPFSIAVGIILLVNPRAATADDAEIRKSVVKISASKHSLDPFRPWTRGEPYEITNSGVVIAGKRILTNSHVVNNAGPIYIQADKSSEKLIAKVESQAPGIDLAVLKLDDESFFDAHPPLAIRSKLPDLKQTVFTYGFPTGGSELSITRGIVSRVEYVEYYLFTEGLRIQVDAAVNLGNNGGPAVVDGQLIGLVYSRLESADNIGYIIPAEEIELFLKDIQDGRYDGKPVVGIDFQNLENATLRTRYKLDKTTTGILVRKVHRPGPPDLLRVGDVITRIGDHAIDNSGMVRMEGDRLIESRYMIQRCTRDGRLPLTIVRDGREIKLDLPVQPAIPRLFSHSAEKPFSYFIFGPLAFSEATENYISAVSAMYGGGGDPFGGDEEEDDAGGFRTVAYSGNPIFTRYGDRPAFPGERIVIIPHPMFTHKMGKGYDDPYGNAVAEVNGVRIRNLAHLVEVIRDADGEYIEFTFHGKATDALVFKRKEALDATEEVLGDNGIRQPCSPDIAPIWKRR